MTDEAISREMISRRTFLKGGAASASTIFLGSILGKASALAAQPVATRGGAVRVVAPSEATVLPGFLAAKLQWEYTAEEAPHTVLLTIATKQDRKHPVAHATLAGTVTIYAVTLVPNETYVWELQPMNEHGGPTVAATRGSFTIGPVRLLEDAPPAEMYKNARKGARFVNMDAVAIGNEPLSPWYDVKSYTMAPPPKFAEIKDAFPRPVFDGHSDALEAYWYSWKTILEVWCYAPYHPDHQAVANLNGYPTWADYGCTDLWDSFCSMHYARYGHQAYPFITQYDNAYARQHENGFIAMQSDNDNFEWYPIHPAFTPYLIGWAEWNYYQVSGDLDRLRRVFIPLAKNYEWFMTYMRHNPDGIYGFDTPGSRDTGGTDTFVFAFPATAFRAVETLAMVRIAAAIGRPDMAEFFTNEHKRLGDYINQHFWDDEHQLYNDRCELNHLWPPFRDPQLAGKFVTEVTPGVIYKPAWTFTPLLAEIAPPRYVQALVRLLQDPNGFNRPYGIGHDSVDSTPQGYLTNTTPGAGSIWPPIPQVAQEGFRCYGEWSVAQEAAEKYFNTVVAGYMKDKTIHEWFDCKDGKFKGQPDFVGWAGLAPIANFIEYILGLDINVPQKNIVWHVQRTERHGLQHLMIGDFYVDLLCEARTAADAPCSLTVTSGGDFTLQTVVAKKIARHQIRKGTVKLRVG